MLNAIDAHNAGGILPVDAGAHATPLFLQFKFLRSKSYSCVQCALLTCFLAALCIHICAFLGTRHMFLVCLCRCRSLPAAAVSRSPAACVPAAHQHIRGSSHTCCPVTARLATTATAGRTSCAPCHPATRVQRICSRGAGGARNAVLDCAHTSTCHHGQAATQCASGRCALSRTLCTLCMRGTGLPCETSARAALPPQQYCVSYHGIPAAIWRYAQVNDTAPANHQSTQRILHVLQMVASSLGCCAKFLPQVLSNHTEHRPLLQLDLVTCAVC